MNARAAIWATLFSLGLGLSLCLAAPGDGGPVFGGGGGGGGQVESSARSRFSLPKVLNFEQFKRLFKRNYESISEELERRQLFLGRAFRAFISAIGYKHAKSDSYLAINHMSDWRLEQIRSLYMSAAQLELEAQSGPSLGLAAAAAAAAADDSLSGRPLNGTVGPSERNPIAATEGASRARELIERLLGSLPGRRKLRPRRLHLPDEVFVDHRSSNCFFEPRNQKKCGSCYAFAVISLYEWMICRATGSLTALSEQYLVDCGQRSGLKGCNGGSVVGASEFVRDYGLELSENYPYRGKQRKCPYPIEADPSEMGSLRVDSLGQTRLPMEEVERVLERTPVVIYMTPSKWFSEYGGGVDRCEKLSKGGLHMVLLVGHGREDGNDYWLIRNSYSTDWGERGYYKLRKGSKCLSAWNYFHLLVEALKADLNVRKNPNHDASFLNQTSSFMTTLRHLFGRD